MGKMKWIAYEIETHLQNHEFGKLLEYLQEFERENAKEFLFGCVEMLGKYQTPVNWETPEKVPARYLEHLTESNWHSLHTLILWQQGEKTGYSEETLRKADRALVNALREGANND